jgi:hypothetical protein
MRLTHIFEVGKFSLNALMGTGINGGSILKYGMHAKINMKISKTRMAN